MNHSEEATERFLGSVVTGSKPWNCKYNVGLVVAQSYETESFKIMWMNPKGKVVESPSEYPSIVDPSIVGDIVYTWEHPTSVNVISRNECHG
jgi:hypothetical protein